MSKESKSQLVEEVEQQVAENEETKFDAAKFLEDDSIEPAKSDESEEETDYLRKRIEKLTFCNK